MLLLLLYALGDGAVLARVIQWCALYAPGYRRGQCSWCEFQGGIGDKTRVLR